MSPRYNPSFHRAAIQWYGHLPQRSILMGKKDNSGFGNEPELVPNPEAATETFRAPQRRVRVAFLVSVEGAREGSPENSLLLKMLEATGIPATEIAVFAASADDSSLEALAELQPEYVIALGTDSARALPTQTGFGIFHEFSQGTIRMRLLTTHALSTLLTQAPAKREAWEHLQKLVRELGYRLPPKRS